MEKIQKRNRELFRVPPYILYVSRAFSTLEGIGLSADEDYSIISEAYPYLAKRLLIEAGLPTAKSLTIRPDDVPDFELLKRELGLPPTDVDPSDLDRHTVTKPKSSLAALTN